MHTHGRRPNAYSYCILLFIPVHVIPDVLNIVHTIPHEAAVTQQSYITPGHPEHVCQRVPTRVVQVDTPNTTDRLQETRLHNLFNRAKHAHRQAARDGQQFHLKKLLGRDIGKQIKQGVI